jgi:single-strand DNA-binding protein
MSMNRVTLLGNLTRDPTLRSLGNGTEVSDFSLAMSEVIKSRDGEKDERVCFVDVVVWNAQAKACAEFLRKGSKALIEGKLQLDEWTDKTSGEKRTKLKVRADRVHFVGSPARSADTDQAPADRPSSREASSPPRGARPRPASSREEAALIT